MAENENLSSSHSAQLHKFLLAGLLIVAFVLRAWQPENISIEHFDEGVYASNFYSIHLDYRYPDQHLYAPPLFPAILEWVLIFTGNPHAVAWVNIIFGTALVAAIWWLTKLIVCKEAALAATAIATFSDFLIQYSRAVLTDTPMCLFTILAVGCGVIALRDRRTLFALLAALFTAAAWWTKYNGWLALAMTGAGLAGWIVFERPKKTEWLPRLGLFLLIATGAFLFWLPCLWQLQQYGGYATVAKNHAGYVVGLSGWIDSFRGQLKAQQYYSDLMMFSYLAGFIVFQIAKQPNIMHWNRKFWFLIFFIILVSALNEPLLLLFAVSIYGLVKNKQMNRLGFWILLAWTIGLFVSTPLYRPYPRLMMLLLTSLIIASGAGITATLKSSIHTKVEQGKVSLIRRLGLLVLCIYFTLSSGVGESIYQDRAKFEKISTSIIDEMQNTTGTMQQIEGLNAIVYVVGEPGLYYHLASDSSSQFEFIAQPASSLAMLTPKPNEPNLPTFLALGPHAKIEMQELQKQSALAEMVERYEYQASDLVLLDEVPPTELEENRQQFVELWKLKRY